MNRNFKITMGIISIIFILLMGSLWTLNNKYQTLSTEYSNLTTKYNKIKNKNIVLKEQKKVVVQNNVNSDTKNNENINRNLNSLFNALYTFDSESKSDRATKVKSLVSDEVYNQLFPKDVKEDLILDGVTSELISINIYSKLNYDNNTNGQMFLVDVEYGSKYKNNEEQKQKKMYKISYDTNSNKVVNLEEVGITTLSGEYN